MAKGQKKDKVETAPAETTEVKTEVTPENTPEVTPDSTPEATPNVAPEEEVKAPKAAKAAKVESVEFELTKGQMEVFAEYPEYPELYVGVSGGIFVPNGIENHVQGLTKVKNPHFKAK